MKYVEIGSRAHRRASVSMLLGSVVTFAVLYSPQPLLRLFSTEYHVAPATASSSISLSTIALAFGMLFVSALSNAWGRKGVMSVSLVLTSILAILSGLVRNFDLFLALRFMEGISIAGFPAVAMAYLNEEFAPQGIGRVIGVYVAGTAIGGFAGRILMGALTDIFNWHVAMMLLGIGSLICSVWFWLYLPESNNFCSKKVSVPQWVSSMKKSLFNKNLLYMYATGFLFMGVYTTILNYIGYPLTEAPYYLSQTVVGFLFVVNLIGTWSSVWFGKLADHHSRRHVLGSAIAIFLIGTLLTTNGYLWIKIIGVAVVVFGFFAGHSVASGWIGVLALNEYKAEASSFYLLFYYSGSSVVGWSSGFFLDRFGWNGLIYYLCALLVVAVLVSSHAPGSNPSFLKSRTVGKSYLR